MELKILDKITADFGEFLKERGFREYDGVYTLDTKSVKVEYNEDKRLCSLLASEAGADNFTALSEWLVDERTSVNDAKSVVLDFSEATDKLIGIKKVRTSEGVKLPQKAAAGETPNVEALCGKFLAVFPQYKETYKEHIAQNGAFLPITFFKATAVVELRKLLEGGNPKALGKMMGMLSSMYAEGDREVGNIVAGVIIAGAIGTDKELLERALEAIDSPYLKPAVKEIVAISAKNKNLKKVLN